MTKLTFELIGSGGAFDTAKLNSSFLIHKEGDNRKILIDCGYNVFHYIKENNYDIEDVLITHTHFDHIGSLESLIYYNYFVKGIQTNVFSGPKVVERLKYILDVNKIYYNGEIIPTEICKIRNLDGLYPNHYEILEMNHIVTPSYGFVFKGYEKNNPKYIVITGDTKASKRFASWIENKFKEIPNLKMVIYQDFSEWDNPLENIHCCKTDFEETYSTLIEKYNLKFIFYHNDSNVGHKEDLYL